MKDISKVESWILRLATIKRRLESILLVFLDCYRPSPRKPFLKNDFNYVMYSNIMLLLHQFKEVYFHIGSLDAPMKVSFKIAKPAVERIQRWNEIHEARDLFLAHISEGKDGEFLSVKEIVRKYNFPTAYAEAILLAECAITAIDIVLQVNREVYQKALAKVKSDKSKWVERGIRDPAQAEKEIDVISDEITKLAKENKSSTEIMLAKKFNYT